MRTLAVRQPWATFIAEGTKTVEVRSWKTDFRGEILIVASGRPLKAENIEGKIEILPSQVLVCTVILLDCRLVEETDLEGACCDICPGEEYAWVLANPRHVQPIPHKGKLNLYSTPDEEIEYLPMDEHYLDQFCKAKPA